MGDPRRFLPDNKFTVYMYRDTPGWEVKTVNEIRGKVVNNIGDPSGRHTSLPMGAGSSNIYFRLGPKGDVVQGRVYINRLSFLDLDWGHAHRNNPRIGGDGQFFPKGVIHVHSISPDGRLPANARLMTDEEISLYGPLIKEFAPNVKFKP